MSASVSNICENCIFYDPIVRRDLACDNYTKEGFCHLVGTRSTKKVFAEDSCIFYERLKFEDLTLRTSYLSNLEENQRQVAGQVDQIDNDGCDDQLGSSIEMQSDLEEIRKKDRPTSLRSDAAYYAQIQMSNEPHCQLCVHQNKCPYPNRVCNEYMTLDEERQLIEELFSAKRVNDAK